MGDLTPLPPEMQKQKILRQLHVRPRNVCRRLGVAIVVAHRDLPGVCEQSTGGPGKPSSSRQAQLWLGFWDRCDSL